MQQRQWSLLCWFTSLELLAELGGASENLLSDLLHWKTIIFCLPKKIFTSTYGPGTGIKARRKPKDIYPWWAFFFLAELSLLPVLTSNSFWKLRRHCVLKCVLFRHLMDYILGKKNLSIFVHACFIQVIVSKYLVKDSSYNECVLQKGFQPFHISRQQFMLALCWSYAHSEHRELSTLTKYHWVATSLQKFLIIRLHTLYYFYGPVIGSCYAYFLVKCTETFKRLLST